METLSRTKLMGGIFSSPKTQKPPPLPEEEVLPTTMPDDPSVGKRRKHRGRSETRITGELEPVTTKKTLLG